MADVRCVEYEPRHHVAYLDFARQQFGPTAHQATPDYLAWLYDENPARRSGHADLLLAVADDGAVVGCVHKMRFPWLVDGIVVDVPAIHNLAVSQAQRGGVGLMLVLKAFAGDEHALVPAAPRPVSLLYGKLRCQAVRASWYRKILRGVRGALRLGLKSLFGYEAPRRCLDATQDWVSLPRDCQRSLAPEAGLVEKIVTTLNDIGSVGAAPHWDAERFRWRFFHPRGPKHLLLYWEEASRVRNFAVLSLGPRQGLNVGRIVTMAAASPRDLRVLLAESEKAIRCADGDVLLMYSADERLNRTLNDVGWRRRADAPETFFFHRDRMRPFASYSFDGGVGDFGFEAIEAVTS